MHAPSSVVALTAAAVIAAALMTGRAMSAARPEPAPLPQRLSDTGLFEPGTATPRAGVLAFAPQYPLWSDGSRKRRWIALPPGSAIDAAKLDAWEFPVGTKLWKEFGFGRVIETRYIERLTDGSWRFATYVWNAAGTEATLAPDDGVVVDVAGAPGGRYTVPSRNDCLACHEGAAVPVLGFSALQLSADRDPLAPHADAPERCAARSALACRERLVAQPAFGGARSSAAHRCAVANSARRAGLSARQLRSLPQRGRCAERS